MTLENSWQEILEKVTILPLGFILDDDGDGPWNICVNGRWYEYGSKSIGYSRVCAIAGVEKMRRPTVAWYIQHGNPQGELAYTEIGEPESCVFVEKDMVFNVVETGKA